MLRISVFIGTWKIHCITACSDVKYRYQYAISNSTDCNSTGKSLSEALIFASTNPQYDNKLFNQSHENSKLKPEENMLCTEILSDIQNNFCTQHVLPMFCKKKSFWQIFTCNLRFLVYILVLLFVLLWFLVDLTVHFYYCITLPIVHMVLKEVYCSVNIYYCTAVPIIYVPFSKTRASTFISTVFIIGT